MIYITLDSIRCHTETDEAGSDEPYVLVTTVDMQTPGPVPNSRVFRYGPFGDVDSQETHFAPFQAVWGLASEERRMVTPDEAIFVVSLMENDDGDPEALRGVIALAATGALSATIGATRATRVQRLLEDINSAMGTPTGLPNLDDRVGVQELRFTPGELATAETGNPGFHSLRFHGDGGDYTTTFKAVNRGQAAWRYCSKCRALYFAGFSPNLGVCPAGGSHAQSSGFTYFLPHEHPGPMGGQDLWRFCGRCLGMVWNCGPGDRGRCAAGGGHDPQGFATFFLPHDHGGFGQDQWRYCGSCRAMFWNGEANKGVCPAGGSHNALGFNFKLDYS